MRILAVRPGPAFSVQDVHDGWLWGLRSIGQTVVDYNHDARVEFYARAAREHADGHFELALEPQQALAMSMNSLHAACYQYGPDVLLVTSGFYVMAEALDVIRARGTKVVLLHTESPYEDDLQVQRAAHADLNLINDPTNLDQFRAVAPTHYVPHGYLPGRHRPRTGLPEHASDVCFVGTGFASRIEFMERVDWTGVDLALAGQWQRLTEDTPLRKYLAHDITECVDNEQTAQLYAATKASWNLYRREATHPELSAGWAMGPREVELAAMSVFFLRDPRGEGDALLPMLPTFAGPEDFGEQLRWWLAHDDAREDAARGARQAVADRRFDLHAKQLLRLLDT
jgi:spore maturation protein CgeB